MPTPPRPADPQEEAPPDEAPPDDRPAHPPWWGGTPVWRVAAPVAVTCGNFALLLVVCLPQSPAFLPGFNDWLNDLYFALGGEWTADWPIFGALMGPAALPGAAYTLRRDGTGGRGWRNALLVAAVTWVLMTAMAVAMVWVVRGLH